jgi:hypothetical protein
VWNTRIRDSSFVDANLAGSALGPTKRMKHNRYERVSFARADLRDVVCSAGVFNDVDFDHTKLVDIDFRASRFERCRFTGPLREVVFWHRHPIERTLRANNMTDVDLSAAELHWTEFRGLDLDSLRWPESDDHVLVDCYPEVLRGLLTALAADESVMGRVVRALAERDHQWVGANQRRGIVFNRLDLLEELEPTEVERAVGLVRTIESAKTQTPTELGG